MAARADICLGVFARRAKTDYVVPHRIMECLALGKPVVTTRVASLPEMAAGGVNYLAEPADPHSLAQALLEASTALRRTGRENGASPRPPMRSWRKVGEEWSQLIQAL